MMTKPSFFNLPFCTPFSSKSKKNSSRPPSPRKQKKEKSTSPRTHCSPRSKKPKEKIVATNSTANCKNTTTITTNTTTQQVINIKPTTVLYTLEGYTVSNTILGEGSFGSVYSGKSSTPEATSVAIKIVKKKNLTQRRRQRLDIEIEVLTSLRHPNIIKLLSVQENDDLIFLVFEQKTEDLYSYLRQKGRVTDQSIVQRIFTQLISAVAYCHSQGVAHLDIKLENILLDENQNVFLADFGFATRFSLESPGKMSNWCGSPYTVAPEIITKTPYEGAQADIWSIGSVIYTMLCGCYPFQVQGGNTTEVLIRTKNGKMNSWKDDVNVSVKDLVGKMLVRDPKKRFRIKQIQEHPWYKMAEKMNKISVQLEPNTSIEGCS